MRAASGKRNSKSRTFTNDIFVGLRFHFCCILTRHERNESCELVTGVSHSSADLQLADDSGRLLPHPTRQRRAFKSTKSSTASGRQTHGPCEQFVIGQLIFVPRRSGCERHYRTKAEVVLPVCLGDMDRRPHMCVGRIEAGPGSTRSWCLRLSPLERTGIASTW